MVGFRACVATLAFALVAPASAAWATAPPADVAAAAQHGNLRAEVRLANMYFAGVGVSRDRRLAAHWYRLAAAQGDSSALYMLGMMDVLGTGGVPYAPPVGVRLFRVSAARGNPAAATALAVSYERGIGVPRNRALALVWHQRAQQLRRSPTMASASSSKTSARQPAPSAASAAE